MPTDRAATRRARYRQLRREGLCTSCSEKAEFGFAKCQKCLKKQRDYGAKRTGKAPHKAREPKPPEEPVETPPALKLWEMLDWLRPDPPGLPPSAGPVQQEEELDPLALAPEVAIRAEALRFVLRGQTEDDEGEEFAAWGPGPRSSSRSAGSYGELVFGRGRGHGIP